MRIFRIMLCVALVGVPAFGAEDARTRAAREELDKQLRELDQLPPPTLLILFDSPADLGFKLVETQFMLDDVKLVAPSADELSETGVHPIFIAKVPPGRHQLTSRVVFVRSASAIFTYVAGFRWKLETKASFETSPGVEVRVRVVPSRVAGAKVEKDELKLSYALEGTVLSPEPASPVPAAKVEKEKPAPVVVTGTLVITTTAKTKPVAAQVRLFGETLPDPGLVPTSAPLRLEVNAGRHVVEVLAPGLLAQTQSIDVAAGAEIPLTFELAPAPKKSRVTLSSESLELTSPFNFSPRTAALMPDARPLIAEVIDALVRGSVKKVSVEAHTDNRGDPAALKKLSEDRAEAVAEALRAAGVDRSRLEATGFGGTRPRAPNLTAAGRKRNNRVELRVPQPEGAK